MRRRDVSVRVKAKARPAAALLALTALCAALIPSTHARQQDVRPRRAAVTQTSAAAQQQQTAQQTGQQKRPPQTPAQPRQTPTSAPATTPQPQGNDGRPALKTSPSAAPDEAPQKDASGQEVDPDEVVRVETNLVNLHVRVIDRNNRPIDDVRDDEFKVFENGVPQQIQFVTREEVPITYGLVVDNSGSIRSQINQVIEAGKSIVNANKPGDETFVVRFIGREQIEMKQDFTADKQSLDDALDDMYVDGGQTAVIDAVYLSAEHAAERRKNDPADEKRRRALILVTDGEDRESFYKQEQLFESLKEEDVQIFVIGFVNELDKDRGFIKKSKRDTAVALLDRMAKETGGRTFYPNSLAELPGIADEITKDLRTQYVISYKPTSPARAGEYRPVRVAVADAPGRDKRIAVTRSGYTAKGSTQPPAAQTPPTVRRQ
ncbi:MAG TPA: VWA domain-containing protein [Pyrinomonadaceae bacterium]|nr:VWA domain-containing protein [Pyrinomonadaceae bacterium]